MLSALIYLFKTLFFRITMFFKRWYWGGFFVVYGQALRMCRFVVGSFDPRLNVRFLFKPLYQEYNITGYILGFIVRGFKVVVGSVLYGAIMIIAMAVYLLWALIPAGVAYKVIIGS